MAPPEPPVRPGTAWPRRLRRASCSPSPALKRQRETEQPLPAASAPCASVSAPSPRPNGKSGWEGEWGGGLGRLTEGAEGAAELPKNCTPATLPNNTHTLQSPLELLLLESGKVLNPPRIQPPTPGYKENLGVLPPTLGSTALESQQVGLEGEDWKAEEGWAGARASFGLARGQWPQLGRERVTVWARAAVWLVCVE